MEHQYRIHVRDEAQNCPWADLTPILESLLPVKFGFGKSVAAEEHGELILEDENESSEISNAPVVSSLSVPRFARSSESSDLAELLIDFAPDRDVPFPFRGRTLRVKSEREPRVLSPGGKQRILASSERGPVWVVSEEAGVKHFQSAFALPKIPANGNLRDILNGDRFLELLPLISWLREIGIGAGYEGPPPRACFMFDDPNLHWPRYGFVDFRQIADHAAKENYHVSFATIPLDAWFTHSAAAEAFKSHANRLSLLIHGNDHIKRELARNYTQPQRVVLLNQAIRRIERLERRAGLRVCRLMVPPHGACSEEMLATLPECEFEGACISHGSLRAHNKTKRWTGALGYLPSEIIAGCPVMPRWGLTGNAANRILLAAFLKQPIILMGHHQDLRDGVELLDGLARFINGLGPVSWSNVSELSRMNYRWRLQGESLAVQPLSRKTIVRMPAGASILTIDKPPDPSWESWRISGINGTSFLARTGDSNPIPERFGSSLSIEVAPAPQVVASPCRRPVVLAFARRLLTEGRDRFRAITQFAAA